ncbi:MAG TPA: glycosyl transferase [Terriglobia bacterium]|nr:glycosyl transferase [Terriglobia bacterium]
MTEHYATLFDNHFLLQGLCLHRSLTAKAAPFHLWILCMDEAVENHLLQLDLPNVTLLPLRAVETEKLKRVKGDRTISEYCWTLTPFLPRFVFDRAPDVKRVTYVDADLYLFDDPAAFFDEFDGTGKHVLITDHAYAPEYDQSAKYGRFCVQFVTFRNTAPAMRVLSWWQERCLEWCYARRERGKFGDQMYLDVWPELFGDEVHVLSQKRRTIAPWNVGYLERESKGQLDPVFYHFHALRIRPDRKITLFSGYHVGTNGRSLYANYVEALREAAGRVQGLGIQYGIIPKKRTLWAWGGRIKRRIFDTEVDAIL